MIHVTVVYKTFSQDLLFSAYNNTTTMKLLRAIAAWCLLSPPSYLSFFFSVSRYRKLVEQSPLSSGKEYDDGFDGKEFEAALKSMGPIWDKTLSSADSSILNTIRDDQISKSEEIFREYPYEYTALPLLPDCNNYYSGSFGEYFWHQNADQVYVYIPINEDINKKDIHVSFEARKVSVSVNENEEITFQCLERIIPDGSFWIVEADKDGKRYIQLDLEKRYRMINWKSLFGEPRDEDVQAMESKSEMLEKLFSANKGMSKLTGAQPESMKDMLSNEDLVKMISSKIYDTPQAVAEGQGGNGEPWIDVEDLDLDPITREDIDLADDDNDNDVNGDDYIIDSEIVE